MPRDVGYKSLPLTPIEAQVLGDIVASAIDVFERDVDIVGDANMMVAGVGESVLRSLSDRIDKIRASNDE